MKIFKTLLMITLVYGGSVMAQDVQNSRRMSQKVSLTRTIGTTDISIVYHSPLAKGREIFGGIVPYDFVVDGKEYPWRAGSNERTTIEFEHDVFINGNPVKAGKYGLVVLVNQYQWTFILSTDMSWGAFQYKPDDDVLRVSVPTKSVPYQEWLSYSFTDPKLESTDVTLTWTDVNASFTIATDVSANIIAELSAKDTITASDYRILATETMRSKKDTKKAMEFVEIAISNLASIENERSRQFEEFAANMLKADLLIATGETRNGEKLRSQTLANSDNFQVYYYGLNTLLVKKDKEGALKLLTDNIKTNPEQWEGYLALGEYYLQEGNQEKVVEHFKKAYEYAPDNWKNYARYLYLQNKLVLERN